MPRVGVRELKNQTTEVIRNVRENQAEYIITYRGRPVAVLLPVHEQQLSAEDQRVLEAASLGEELWTELATLRKEIGESWQAEETAVELISNGRR